MQPPACYVCFEYLRVEEVKWVNVQNFKLSLVNKQMATKGVLEPEEVKQIQNIFLFLVRR